MKKIIAFQRLNNLARKAVATTVFLGALHSVSAQVTETFSTAGASTWTVPAGVTSITIESWGGGGGGGGARAGCASSCEQTATGGGGKGGMYARNTVSVNPGDVLSLSVGNGGTGGVGNTSSGDAGGASSVTFTASSTVFVQALGGNGGTSGGLATNGVGATTYSTTSGSEVGILIWNSGNGANGLKTTSRQSGGGGGGGAGNAGDGATALNAASGGGGPLGASAGGAGGTADGGAGGAGGSGTNSGATNAGADGAVRGGAGGGARAYSATSQLAANGGNGGNGEIRITYIVNICSANAGAALANICQNGTSAALGGTVGGLSTTGVWSDGGAGGTFSPSATDLNATWTPPASFTGTATLTLTTTDGGCATAGSATKTIMVATAPATPAFASGPAVLCEGGSATYIATISGTSAVLTYAVVSGGATIDAVSGAVGTVTSDFTVRVTASNDCGTANADFAVTVNPAPAAPTITAGGATTFCSGGSVTLSSSQASGNTWSSTESTQDIIVSQGGNFSVTYTDVNGCSSTSAETTVTVNTPTVPVITATGAASFCEGGSVTLTSSATSGNVWSTNETTESIVVDESDAITVTATDGNGCSATSATTTVTENINPVPVITAAGPVSFCTGGSVTITSSETSGNVWSNGETTESIVVEESDAITVTVTDANGCSGTSNEIVTIEGANVTPVITASGPITFCEGGSVTITSSETSGNMWSNGATGNSIVVDQSANITLTNSNACVTGTSNEIVVTENPNPAVPTISAGGPLAFCAGGNVVLTSSASSGNVWSNTAATNSITVTQAGSYSVVNTNANGCSATSTATIVTTNAVPAAAANLTDAITITATPAGQTYQWINCTTNQPVAGATTATFTATANGSYKVIVTNASGCKDTSACVQVSKVGLDDLVENAGISLYPNPSNGMVTLVSDIDQSLQVVVLDAAGKAVLQREYISGSTIDVTALDAGIYFFNVQTSKGTSSHRMVLNR